MKLIQKPFVWPFPHITKDKQILTVAQDLPFFICRAFWITGMKKGDMRGGHAHKTLNQMFVCLSGSIHVKTYIPTKSDSNNWFSNPLISNIGYLVPPMNWVDVEALEDNSSFLVLCDKEYDEGDYIRDKDEFNSIQ